MIYTSGTSTKKERNRENVAIVLGLSFSAALISVMAFLAFQL
jgi:hypothetical protein